MQNKILTKRQLINFLESLDVPDDTMVFSFNPVGRSELFLMAGQVVGITRVMLDPEIKQAIEVGPDYPNSVQAIAIGV